MDKRAEQLSLKCVAFLIILYIRSKACYPPIHPIFYLLSSSLMPSSISFIDYEYFHIQLEKWLKSKFPRKVPFGYLSTIQFRVAFTYHALPRRMVESREKNVRSRLIICVPSRFDQYLKHRRLQKEVVLNYSYVGEDKVENLMLLYTVC
jgi:hypothetical protein